MIHIGKNVVIVLALVAAGFFAAWLRFRSYLGTEGRYTDGVQTYEISSADEVRYAVWDAPEVLPETINTTEDERHPALSPDGRFLVFASGERGLGTDLWISELENGTPLEPRLLGALNTAADEWAPCFSGAALYFASDRRGSAGGLDLWRAPYERGVFGEALRLEGGVNTAADETDPAPLPGSEAIVFASNRRVVGMARQRPRSSPDFDLYIAKPRATDEEDSLWSVEPLDELNTWFDERDPAFTADGRTLFFASNREGDPGSEGGFDLYRSALGRNPTRWVEPEPLVGVNTEGSERSPSPSRDGFALYYESEGAPGALGTQGTPGVLGIRGAVGGVDLFRARSLELFRTPGKPVGWRELLVLSLLLAIALLAWLAKQWEQLEVLYKCFLISLVVHLLVMWWLRDVYPEGGEYELEGDSNRIRVRLISNDQGALAANSERSGQLEVARAEAESAIEVERFAIQADGRTEPANAEPLELARPEAGEAQTPERARGAEPEREAHAREAVEVRQIQETFERFSASSPSLTLDPSASAASAAAAERSETEAGTPRRAESADVALAEAVPSQVAQVAQAGQARNGEGAELPDAPSAERFEIARVASPSAPDFDVASPQEVHERHSAEAPELALEAGFLDTPAPRGEQTARPARANAPSVLEGRVAAAPEGAPLEARVEAREQGLEPLAGRVENAVEKKAVPPSAVAFADRDSTEFERMAQNSSASDEEIVPVPAETARPESGRETADPDRFEPAAASESALELTPTPLAMARPPAREERDSGEPDFRYAVAESSPSERALRAVEFEDKPEAGLPRIGAATTGEGVQDAPERTRDWESGIERDLSESLVTQPAPERRAAPPEPDDLAPRRFEREEHTAESAPRFEPLATDALPPESGDVARSKPEWEHTPYRSRTGEHKTRAIELHGGSKETEAAVAAGLAYLARIQKREGYWGSPEDRHDKYGHVSIGKTGLALLAFMGAGHTPESGTEYSRAVDRAIDFLLAVQDDDTGHFGYTSSYSHGIATYALAECYALTGDERLPSPLRRAVRHIVGKQQNSRDPRFHGGWGYYYPDADRTFDPWPRASVTVWQVMALESARLGKLPVADQVFADAKSFLAGAWDRRRGAFRYSHDPDRLNDDWDILPGSTPASLFALSLLGEKIASNDYRKARRFVMERAPESYRFRGTDDFVLQATGNLYFWYYGTLAMFRVGGDEWERWNTALKETLLPSQEDDGSWEPISPYATTYGGDDDDDRAYSTAINVLTLEVYYRYFTPLLKVD